MGFSPEWERLYDAGRHFIDWPWSNVVTWVTRFDSPGEQTTRVLELGCGPGINTPFFLSRKMDYFAVDGSRAAIVAAQKRFADIKDNFAVADFTRGIPFPGTFDLIVERAAISHNSTADIRRCLDNVLAKLKPGGRFIGLDWFSTEHSEYGDGREADDLYTKTDYPGSSYAFADCGKVHFSDEAHLADLFADFDIEFLQHNTRTHIRTQSKPAPGYNLATWDIVAKKPAS